MHIVEPICPLEFLFRLGLSPRCLTVDHLDLIQGLTAESRGACELMSIAIQHLRDSENQLS